MVWIFSALSSRSKTVLAAAAIFSVTAVIYIIYTDELRAKNKNSKELRILCFGDSITRGHTGKYDDDGKAIYHPYSLTLKKRLKNRALKRRTFIRKIVVHNRGVNGEKVYKSMEGRLPRLLKVGHYDWVILLGGTNDFRALLRNHPITKNYDRKLYQPILNALLKLHRTVHKHGGRTVAVTIPGRQCELSNKCRGLKAVRLWTNERLRKFAAKFKDKVVLADLDTDMRIERYVKYWSDEVHFTPQGYDMMGATIYNALYDSLYS